MKIKDIKINDVLLDKKTGELARVIYIEGSEIEYEIIDKEVWPISHSDSKYGIADNFEPLPRTKISVSEFGKLIRCETTYNNYVDEKILFPLFTVDESYTSLVEDLIIGLTYLENNTNALFFIRWFETILCNTTIIRCDSDFKFDNAGWISEKKLLSEALNSIYFEYMDFQFDADVVGEIDPDNLSFALETLNMILANRNKPMKEWELPYSIIDSQLVNLSEKTICSLTSVEKETFRFLLEKASDTNSEALKRLGYLIYTGDTVYEQDWPRCRDIFEKHYDLTGDANTANTLGYIYYYGRCNGGVGEYEKAFKYFSIGHAFGLYESTYKLGDMFTHGYGVRKNEETASNLYWMVYDDAIKRFVRGDYQCQFADAALRIGNMFKNGIYEETDPEEALHYYLQAEMAIKMRMNNFDHYGDKKVFAGIQKSINELLNVVKTKKKISDSNPFVFFDILNDGRRIKVEAKQTKSGAFKLIASYLAKPNEAGWDIPRILVTYGSIGYSALVDDVSLLTEKDATVQIVDSKDSFIYNSIELYEERDGVQYWGFYYDDKLTAIISSSKFTFQPSKKQLVD